MEAALVVAADHPHHGAIAVVRRGVGDERPAAGAVSVVLAVEPLLAGEIAGAVLAADGPALVVGVTDDPDDAGRPADAQFVGPGEVLDPGGAAVPGDRQERHVVVGIGRGGPLGVDDDLRYRPHAVGLGVVVQAGHEGEVLGVALGAADTVGRGDDQVARGAVDHARGAEVPGQPVPVGDEQGPDGRGTGEGRAGQRHRGRHGRGHGDLAGQAGVGLLGGVAASRDRQPHDDDDADEATQAEH
jgi:hypothetical protein